jgi:ATP synthase protein I
VRRLGGRFLGQKGENALEKGPHKGEKRQDKELLKGLSFLAQIGVTMAACVAIGVFLGRVLDKALGTSPWLLLLFSILGVGAAIKAPMDMGGRR